MAQDIGFDPNNKLCWYFGPLNREETNEILDNVHTNGVFLVRESQSIKGDFVLCVREDSKISHYIINRIQVGGNVMFRIGDQQFPDIPALLNFYKTHYLDTTALTHPAPRTKVITKYDFPGKDEEDLPFRKGEVLEIISKDEEKWWQARNREGRVGQIPVPYVVKYEEQLVQVEADAHTADQQADSRLSTPPIPAIKIPKQLPAKALVIQTRIPNHYDKSQLQLNEGEFVMVTKINPNGTWEGRCNGKDGFFPFTHVKFLDDS